MNAVAEKEEIQEVEQKQYVIFQIGKEEYGVDINQVKEIIKPSKITNVPNTKDYILGVINLRGQIVSVVDLKTRIGFDSEAEGNENKRIITVELKDTLIGLVVDGVNEVVWIDKNDLEPAPEIAGGIKQEFLQGLGKIDDHLLILIDLEKLLFDKKA